MVALPPSAYALKRAVAGFGPELAPILSLEMAAEDVQATRRKHATRKPVQVCRRNFRVRALSLSLSLCCDRGLSLSLSQSLFGGTLSGEDIDCGISCLFAHSFRC